MCSSSGTVHTSTIISLPTPEISAVPSIPRPLETEVGNSRNNLPLLPPEIVHIIFQLLTPLKTTLCNLCLVCKAFNRIATIYLYSGDIKLELDQTNARTASFDKLPTVDSANFKLIKKIHISIWPADFPILRSMREMISSKLQHFLLSIQPCQLTTLVIKGVRASDYLTSFKYSSFFRQQPNIRHLCLPHFRSNNDLESIYTQALFPKLESLYVTEISTTDDIQDLWAVLESSGQRLRSLTIICLNTSRLSNLLEYHSIFSDISTFPHTKASLGSLQDLHIFGFANLGRFLNDCAPNLLDYSRLKMLRLTQCPRIESFLQTICNAEVMPNLKSLQLIQTCSPETFETVAGRLAPLDTLYIVIPVGQNLPKYDRIKTYHARTLKRLWVEHQRSSYVLDNLLRNVIFEPPPGNGYDGFFLSSWDLLEELALGIDLVRDNRPIILPSNLRILRIVSTLPFSKGVFYEPLQDALNIAKNHHRHCRIKGKRSKLSIISFFVSIDTITYLVDQDSSGEDEDLVPSLTQVTIDDVRWLHPNKRIMELERGDILWSDR